MEENILQNVQAAWSTPPFKIRKGSRIFCLLFIYLFIYLIINFVTCSI